MVQIQFSLIKTMKIGRPDHSPIPLRPIISHFCLTPIPPQSGTHICITPKSISMGVDHKCFCHYLRLVSLYFVVKLEKDKHRDLS